MSENTPQSTDATATESGSSPEATEHDASYWQAEAEKWKAQSRKNEAAKKDNAAKLKEYEEWKASQLSEHERDVADARQAGAAEVRAEFSAKLARTAFKAAADGRLGDPDKVLSRIDVMQFLTEDGDVDSDAISEFLDGIAPAKPEEAEQQRPTGLFGDIQGTRSGGHLPLNGDPLLDRVNQILGNR